MTLGEKLHSLRRAQGLSQEQLASRLEVSRQAVSKWENGEAMPGTEYIIPLSRVFGVTADYLLDDGCTEASPPEESPVQSPEKQPLPDRPRLLAGLIMGGAGALGLLLIWVLSTMQLVEIERAVSYFDQAGLLRYTSEWVWDYSFFGFIQYHRLYAVVGILLALLAAGGVLLYRWRKAHGPQKTVPSPPGAGTAEESDAPLPPGE